MKKLLLLISVLLFSQNLLSQVTLTSPNGGEIWQSGTTQTVSWTNTNSTGLVNLDYSTDNGTTWQRFADSLNSMYPSYPWLIPNVTSTYCKVRVTDATNGFYFDESDNAFTIAGYTPTQLTLITPNGGESLAQGTVDTIRWLGGSTSTVNLEYSTDYGSTWISIANLVSSIYPAYGWTIPNTPSTTCKVRVSDYNNLEIADESDAPFTIADNITKTITVIYPNGGETIYNGSQQNITWTSGNVGSVNLYFSPDSGMTWNSIASNIPAYMESYFSNVNSPGTTNALIRISDAMDAQTFDESDSVFTIIDTTSHKITVSYPNRGELLTAGRIDTIRWAANYLTQVKLDYSTDYGDTWINIVGSMPSENPIGYPWVVPNTPSTFCLVRVTDINSPYNFDESDTVFTIQLFKSGEYTVDANTILLDHFNGTTDASVLAYLPSNQPCGAEWPSATPSYSFNPGMNELYQSLTLAPPLEAVQGSATYLKYPGGQLLSQVNGTIEFWVKLTSYGKGLGLVNQGQFYGACAGWTFYLGLDSTGLLSSSAWAAFSMNSGSAKIPLNKWTHVAASWGSNGAKLYINGIEVGSDANTGMPADGYSGNVLIPLGTGSGASAMIDELRISNIQRTNFHIIPQNDLILTYPNGGEVLQSETSFPISWTSALEGNVNIDYSTDKGLNWIPVVSDFPANYYYYYWDVPSLVSSEALVRISLTGDPTIFDYSDSVFTITNILRQEVYMGNEGWNLISFYVTPTSLMARDVFPQTTILQVKTETKSFDPNLPDYLNTLKTIRDGRGYLVNPVSDTINFSVEGTRVNLGQGLNYNQGWNLIGYYYQDGQDIERAFGDIMNSVEEVKTTYGVFNPSMSYEFNSLYYLYPGEGYWLKLTEPVSEFLFPYPYGEALGKKQNVLANADSSKLMKIPWKFKGYQQSTVAYFTITVDANKLDSNCVLGSFVGDECRGIAKVKFDSTGNAFAATVINGTKPEPATFKLFNRNNGEILTTSFTMQTNPGTSSKEIVALNFAGITSAKESLIPQSTKLYDAYPNPFNPSTIIKYDVKDPSVVKVVLYSINGEMVKTLVDEFAQPGEYSVTWNGRNENGTAVVSGVYFVRFIAGSTVQTKKIILMK